MRTVVSKTWIAPLLGLVLASAPRVAQACAVCMAGTDDANRLAFILTTVLLTFLPLLLVGGLVGWLLRRARSLEPGAAAERVAVPVPVLSRTSSSR